MDAFPHHETATSDRKMHPPCVLAYIPESMWNRVKRKKVTQSFNTQFAVVETDIEIVLEIDSSAIII